MSIPDEIIKIEKTIRKDEKSFVSLLVMLCVLWFALLHIKIDNKLLGINLNICIAFFFSLVIFVVWIINKKKINKNNSNLSGIGFLILSNEVEKDDVEKDKFFKLLKDECLNDFNIIVYSYKDFKYYKKHKWSKADIMKKLNLTFLFEIKERAGNINNDNEYEIDIVNTTVLFPFPVYSYFVPALTNDLTKCVNKFIKISHKNNLQDSKQESNSIKLASLYIIAIIKILSKKPDEAFKILDEISYIIKTTETNKKEINYISSNLTYRYLEAYSNTIAKILTEENYHTNPNILNRAKLLQKNMYEMMKKAQRENKIEKRIYKIHYENYLLRNAIIQYEESNISEALNTINKCDFSSSDSSSAYFSKAFLLMMNDKVEESVRVYIKLLKRKYLDYRQIEDILSFIDKHINLNNNDNKIKLNFCYAIINYYKKDKNLAIKIFDEISKQDSIIDEQIEIIKNS